MSAPVRRGCLGVLDEPDVLDAAAVGSKMACCSSPPCGTLAEDFLLDASEVLETFGEAVLGAFTAPYRHRQLVMYIVPDAQRRYFGIILLDIDRFSPHTTSTTLLYSRTTVRLFCPIHELLKVLRKVIGT